MNIGTFTATKDGYTGTLRTLTLNVKAKLVPNAKGDKENSPDFRLQASGHDIGAAWKKTSEAGRDYLSVTLDDPSFAAAVYAAQQTAIGVSAAASRPPWRGAFTLSYFYGNPYRRLSSKSQNRIRFCTQKRKTALAVLRFCGSFVSFSVRLHT